MSKKHELIFICRTACGLEATLMGFTCQAGFDIHDGCIQRSFECWDQEYFVDWLIELKLLHGSISRTGAELIDLYKKCNEILEEYNKKLKEL